MSPWPPQTKPWLLILFIHTSYTLDEITAILSLKFTIHASVEEVKAKYKYWSRSSDIGYRMLACWNSTQRVVDNVLVGAEMLMEEGESV